MSKLKDALREWEEREGQRALDAEVIKLCGWLPPIDKMDHNVIGQLKKCRYLSLSTNNISAIGKLEGMRSLETLSLGRNTLTALENLDQVAGTLRQLWISYNGIESLAGIECLKELRVLYMNTNRVSEWSEFERLKELPNLEELTFAGNPLERTIKERNENWRAEVLKRLPNLEKLDGLEVTQEEAAQANKAKLHMSARKSVHFSPNNEKTEEVYIK